MASEEQKAMLQLLNSRISKANERLGSLDYQQFMVEQSKAQVRVQLQRDTAEVETLIVQLAKDNSVNLQDPNVRFNMLTGEFTSGNVVASVTVGKEESK